MSIAATNKSISKGQLCQHFGYECSSRFYYNKLRDLILNDEALLTKLSWSSEDKNQKYAAQAAFIYPESKIILDHFEINLEDI